VTGPSEGRQCRRNQSRFRNHDSEITIRTPES
jgi:hypothetical protein